MFVISEPPLFPSSLVVLCVFVEVEGGDLMEGEGRRGVNFSALIDALKPGLLLLLIPSIGLNSCQALSSCLPRPGSSLSLLYSTLLYRDESKSNCNGNSLLLRATEFIVPGH